MQTIDYRDHAFKVSLYASIVSILIVLSFRDYFLFVPFKNGVDFLSTMGALSLVGWIALLAVPPIVLSNKAAKWTSSRKWLLVISASFWTFSTLIIKIYGLVVTGQLWASYLLVYPVLIFIEWVLPIFYILLAFRLAKSNGVRRVVVEAAVEPKAGYPQP